MKSNVKSLGMIDGLKISIVMPFYNTNPSLFTPLIESITNQSHQNFEVIIIDDGSTEAQSLEALNKALEDPRYRLIRQIHGGISKARTAGMRQASGDILWFVDSDDLVLPGAFSYMARFFSKHPDYDMLIFKAERQQADGHISFWQSGGHIPISYDMTGKEHCTPSSTAHIVMMVFYGGKH